jgi:hypothetical protein
MGASAGASTVPAKRLRKPDCQIPRFVHTVPARGVSTSMRLLRWLRCRLRLCPWTISYDDGGIYWECGRCGKVNR